MVERCGGHGYDCGVVVDCEVRGDLVNGAYLGVVETANFVRWWVSDMLIVGAEIDHWLLPTTPTAAFGEVRALNR